MRIIDTFNLINFLYKKSKYSQQLPKIPLKLFELFIKSRHKEFFCIIQYKSEYTRIEDNGELHVLSTIND